MQSIPYDPALVLGNLVDEKLLNAVLAISAAGAPADAAQENLNSLILAKRSIDMTIQELTGMGIDASEAAKATVDLDKRIAKAASDMAKAVIASQAAILKAKGGVQAARAAVGVAASIESPIDYNKSQIKQMPLAADSLRMDAQYFSLDENQQDSHSTVSSIKSYVSASTSFLGTSRSIDASAQAQHQASSQYQNHDVAGTLVITAGCTHKDAVLLAPLIIDPDKAVRVWNAVFPNDLLKPSDMKSLLEIDKKANTAKEAALRILSGATYGSSFVGMVHVLRSEKTQSSQSMYSAAAKLQAKMKAGGWFAKVSGGFGVDASFAGDVKRMLSIQDIQSHCSIITMGSIPSIKSNSVRIGVKEFADFDPKAMMDKLATLQNATASDQDSISGAAAAARTGGEMQAMESTKVQSVLTGLSDIDDGQNKMLDINSLMTAFEDYVDKALAGNIGVPINYYLKPITKSQIAQLWVAKYYPEYMAIGGDDSGK